MQYFIMHRRSVFVALTFAMIIQRLCLTNWNIDGITVTEH